MKRWFVQFGAKINGPMTISEVEQMSAKHKDCLIWGKGMGEWIPHADWKRSIEVSLEKESKAVLWQYRFNEKESKLFKLDELIGEIKKLTSFESVYVKSDQEPKWQLLFTARAITERLGLTRRNQLRVPIFGFF